jgi:hypothetical protein
MNDTQLQLSLGSPSVTQPPRANRRPSTFSSRWWFQQMRQIVDCAFDWQPAPPPRPEQAWFSGTQRQAQVNS